MSTYEDAVKRYESLSYKDLAAEFQRLQQVKKELKEQQKHVDDQFDALTKQVLPDKMMEDGMKTITIDGIGRIQMSTQAYCSTKGGMGEPLKQWLREHGHEDIISETINASTLKSFVKDQIELGEEVPPEDLINYQPYIRASVVKA